MAFFKRHQNFQFYHRSKWSWSIVCSQLQRNYFAFLSNNDDFWWWMTHGPFVTSGHDSKQFLQHPSHSQVSSFMKIAKCGALVSHSIHKIVTISLFNLEFRLKFIFPSSCRSRHAEGGSNSNPARGCGLGHLVYDIAHYEFLKPAQRCFYISGVLFARRARYSWTKFCQKSFGSRVRCEKRFLYTFSKW